MRYIVLIISAVWLAIAITVTYAPESVSTFLALEWTGRWLRVGALLPLAIGFVLILSAARFHASWLLRVIGALAVLKGVFLVAAPAAYARSVMEWYIGLPLWAIRLAGLVSTGFALALAVIVVISLFEEDV